MDEEVGTVHCWARRIAWLGIPGVVLASVVGAAQRGPESARVATKRFAMRVVAAGLDNPWEVTWGPDGKLWVTERSALRITRVDPATGERQVAASLEGVANATGPGGVLGMALHPQLLRNAGHDEVFVAVTYDDRSRPPDARVTDPSSPFRHLYAKLLRLRYDASKSALVDPVTILDGLPAGNDHLGLRLAFAPDGLLHLTIGDQGSNQLGNVCNPVLSQRLPTQAEIDRRDWSAYEGKTLRLTIEGGIPGDNPVLNGVRSHVYTYGHRNPQGLSVGPGGALYTTDHGPKSDDEVNVLAAGGNYGWPHVAGLQDDRAYQYARWADSTTPCASLRFSDLAIPASVPREPESAFRLPMMAPVATLFTVPADHNFQDPACGGIDFICWPTVAASSVESYAGYANGIPGWDRVLIVSTLKRGSLYVVPLDASGQRSVGPIAREARTSNRYRDTAVHPDGRTIFVATDSGGLVESRNGGVSKTVDNGGAILAFTYAGESPGDTATVSAESRASGSDARGSRAGAAAPAARPGDRSAASGAPRLPAPPFSRAQVTAGKAAYDASCAVCHGSTLMNGTFATPLAGEYFKRQWSGRTVAELFEKSRTTMPPKAADSLPPATYAAIVAYMLEVNGNAAGKTDLPADATRLRAWRIP
jgi:PQQ-dependent dehydrogenase (s-GDH family)